LVLGINPVFILLVLVRAAISEVLVTRYSRAPEENWRRALRSSAGATILLGCFGAVALVVVGVVMGDLTGQCLVSIAPLLPLVLLQDLLRFAFFAVDKPRSSVWNDAVWLLMLVPLLLLVLRHAQPWSLALAWMGAGAVASVVGLRQARVVPSLVGLGEWWRERRHLSFPFLFEAVLIGAGGQLALYGVAGIAGRVAVTSLRVAQVLLSPVSLVFSAYHLFGLPEAVRVRGGRGLIRFCAVSSMFLACGPMAWYLGLSLIPERWAKFLFAENWSHGWQLALPLSVSLACLAIGIGAGVGVRARRDVARSVPARAAQALIMGVAPCLGAAIAGAPGAAWGTAVGNVVVAALWWRVLLLSVTQIGDAFDQGGRGWRRGAAKDSCGVVPRLSTHSREAR
jgi:hypothetical protein